MRKLQFKYCVYGALAMAMAFSLGACSDEKNDLTPSPGPEIENPLETVTARIPVCLSSGLQGDVLEALQERFPLRGALGEVRAAMFTVEDMLTDPAKIDRFYELGGLVVLIQPTEAAYARLTEGFEHPDAMPDFPGDGVFLFAYDRDRRRYTIGNEMVALSSSEAGESDDPDELLGLGAGKPDGESLPDKTAEEEEHTHGAEYLSRRFAPFVDWLNGLTATEPGSRASSDGYDPRADISSCYWDYETQVPVKLHHMIRHLSGSKKDYLDADGEIRVSCRIYPLFQFSQNGGDARGDYYIVEANVTAYNQQLWNCDYHTHGAMRDYIIGYYMKQLSTSCELLDGSGNTIPTLKFYSNPAPQNLNGSETYTTSTTYGCNVAVSGGYAGKTGAQGSITGGFSASWTNGRTQTLNDVSTTLDSRGAKVSYRYDVQNIHHNMEYTNSKNGKGYPLLSRAEMSAPSAWIWHVPYGAAGASDNSLSSMKLRVTVNSRYACYSWYRPKVTPKEDEFDNDSGETVFTHSICMPDRRRFGVLALKNAGPLTVANIVVQSCDANGIYSDCAEIPSSYNTNEVARIKLTEGVYRMKYRLVDTSAGNKVVGSWTTPGCNVRMGSDENSSTAEISTVNATEDK